MNEVLKDKLGNILNPKIPRYEKKIVNQLNDNSLTVENTYLLKDTLENYDFLYVIAGADSTYFQTAILIKVSDIKYEKSTNNGSYMLSNYTSAGFYAINFNFPSSKEIKVLDRNRNQWGNPAITKIYGINL